MLYICLATGIPIHSIKIKARRLAAISEMINACKRIRRPPAIDGWRNSRLCPPCRCAQIYRPGSTAGETPPRIHPPLDRRRLTIVRLVSPLLLTGCSSLAAVSASLPSFITLPLTSSLTSGQTTTITLLPRTCQRAVPPTPHTAANPNGHIQLAAQQRTTPEKRAHVDKLPCRAASYCGMASSAVGDDDPHYGHPPNRSCAGDYPSWSCPPRRPC